MTSIFLASTIACGAGPLQIGLSVAPEDIAAQLKARGYEVVQSHRGNNRDFVVKMNGAVAEISSSGSGSMPCRSVFIQRSYYFDRYVPKESVRGWRDSTDPNLIALSHLDGTVLIATETKGDIVDWDIALSRFLRDERRFEAAFPNGAGSGHDRPFAALDESVTVHDLDYWDLQFLGEQWPKLHFSVEVAEGSCTWDVSQGGVQLRATAEGAQLDHCIHFVLAAPLGKATPAELRRLPDWLQAVQVKDGTYEAQEPFDIGEGIRLSQLRSLIARFSDAVSKLRPK